MSSWNYRTMGTKRKSYKPGDKGGQLGEDVGREWFWIFQQQQRRIEIKGTISYKLWKKIIFKLKFYSQSEYQLNMEAFFGQSGPQGIYHAHSLFMEATGGAAPPQWKSKQIKRKTWDLGKKRSHGRQVIWGPQGEGQGYPRTAVV